MPFYHVTWEIELWAETPEEAAADALAIQRDPESIATLFAVRDTPPLIEVSQSMLDEAQRRRAEP